MLHKTTNTGVTQNGVLHGSTNIDTLLTTYSCTCKKLRWKWQCCLVSLHQRSPKHIELQSRAPTKATKNTPMFQPILPCSPRVEKQVRATVFLAVVLPDFRILYTPFAPLYSEPAIKRCERLANTLNTHRGQWTMSFLSFKLSSIFSL